MDVLLHEANAVQLTTSMAALDKAQLISYHLQLAF